MQNSAAQGEQLLIFMHIVKTGGTTLRWILEEQFPCSRVLRCYLHHGYNLDKVAAFPERKRRHFRLFTAHEGFGTHKLFPQKSTYLTMLRDPIRRCVSEYYSFIHNQPRWEKIHGFSLDEYLEKLFSQRLDNLQVRYVAGALKEDKLTHAHLERAKDNLTRAFSAVGLLERFQESIVLFGKIFGWNKLVYVKRNENPRRPAVSELNGQQQKKLENAHIFDSQLLEFAKGRFNELLVKYKVEQSDLESMIRKGPLDTGRLYVSRASRKVKRRLLNIP